MYGANSYECLRPSATGSGARGVISQDSRDGRVEAGDGTARRQRRDQQGTQLARFTRTKVQILTQNEQHDNAGRVAAQEAALIFLALLVQTYTY